MYLSLACISLYYKTFSRNMTNEWRISCISFRGSYILCTLILIFLMDPVFYFLFFCLSLHCTYQKVEVDILWPVTIISVPHSVIISLSLKILHKNRPWLLAEYSPIYCNHSWNFSVLRITLGMATWFVYYRDNFEVELRF